MTQITGRIRWWIRRDMPETLYIERASFEVAWTEEEFLSALRQRNIIGMVVEHQNQILGFMIYELHKRRLRILNFAVHPDWRRQGVGTAMVGALKDRLSQQRRATIVLEVRETNLAAQQFFAAQGFQAVSVLRDYYDDTAEDAYLMRYVLPAGEAVECDRVTA